MFLFFLFPVVAEIPTRPGIIKDINDATTLVPMGKIFVVVIVSVGKLSIKAPVRPLAET